MLLPRESGMKDSSMPMEYGNDWLASVPLTQGHVPVQSLLKYSTIPKNLFPSILCNLMLAIDCPTFFHHSTSCYGMETAAARTFILVHFYIKPERPFHTKP